MVYQRAGRVAEPIALHERARAGRERNLGRACLAAYAVAVAVSQQAEETPPD